jgi:hypothetical protein
MFFARLSQAIILSCAFYLILALFILTGCSFGMVRNSDPVLSEQGGSGIILEFPLKRGYNALCTQGAYGIHSHSTTSTLYDLDLDTDNYADEEVFASISGTVYVHMESASSGFGYHVNIDLGNGYYVCIAHLSAIFVSDGEEVTVGQLLGYEGKTGDSSGDHVHIGLHQGDASLPAQYGVSVPATYRVSNQSEGSGLVTLGSEEFQCGLRSAGDDRDGDTYQSDLAINLWHPNGALVKTPDNPRVYLLEEGNARWIENESTFWGLEYDFQDVTLISESELSCYGEGSVLAGEAFIDAAFDTEEDLWLIVGDASDPDRYRSRVRGTGWEHVMASWGLSYGLDHFPDSYGDTSSYMASWPPTSTYVGLRDGTIVKESDASDVYVVSDGFALPVKTWDVYLLMNHYTREILLTDDGMVGELHQVGNCSTDQMCLDVDAVTTCGGGMDLVDGGSTGGDGEHIVEVPEEEEDSDPPMDTGEPQEQEDPAPDEEEETSTISTLSVDADYPAEFPLLTLTVQTIFNPSDLGDGWTDSVSETDADEVYWSQTGDFSSLLGVRINVDVDQEGDGRYDDWYCYGHYATAFLEYGVSVEVTLDGDVWDENDLVTWSPGEESDTHLGCSALLWFGSTSTITEGAVY